MEGSSTQQLVVVVAVAASLLFVLSKLKLLLFSSKPKLNLPPGPWTLPLIGSVHHLVRNSSLQRTMQKLAAKHGPLMQIWLGEVPAVVVSSPEVAQEIMKNQDINFADRFMSTTMAALTTNGSDIAIAPYGERWRQMRKLCTQELLTAARVKSFRHIREEEVARLVQELAVSAAAGETVDLTEMIIKLVNDIIVRCSVGGRTKYRDEYIDALRTALNQLTWVTIADIFPSSKVARMLGSAPRTVLAIRKKLDHIMEKIIDERKEIIDRRSSNGEEAGTECFLDVLLRLQKEGDAPMPITKDVIVMLLLDMFTAGTETSSSMLNWTMAELIRSPRVMEKARTELEQGCQRKSTITEDDIVDMSYLKMVIKESFRMHIPVPLLAPRKCRETSKVMGYDVPKDTTVFVNVWAICRNPKYWVDAEEFKPERFENTIIDYKGNNFEYLPFGSGRRMCPGVSLGLADVELPLASLLYHFDWKLPNNIKPEDIDMGEAPGLLGPKRTNLHLRPIARIVPSNA